LNGQVKLLVSSFFFQTLDQPKFDYRLTRHTNTTCLPVKRVNYPSWKVHIDSSFLYEKELIKKDDLKNLKEIIKEGMPEWLATLKCYDDPTAEDVW